MRFYDGEQVTILPPYLHDPVIVEMQHYGRIAERTDDGFMVDLGVSAQNRHVGPFPAARLAHGWKDGNGRWRP